MKRSTFYLLSACFTAGLFMLTESVCFSYSTAFFLGIFCELYFH